MDAALDHEDGDLNDELRIERVGDAGAGDAGDDGNQGHQHQLRGINREMAILLDAPNEPPMDVFPARGRPDEQPRLRKKRSFYTLVKPSPSSQSQEPEMSPLMANVTRAMHQVPEEHRDEYFANYLVENMTSQNYPNGVGLPQRWGQF
ncbi:hypothetical protein KR084_012196 [Drosophila pseudotakahashii]|nr:hypothetical protein KR084_012196 [Drosophila pseudotakahashii]